MRLVTRFGGALLLVALLGPRPVLAQVTVSVDVTADRHAISPLVYGMNFASAAQLAAGRIPLTRWGGNSTSRYNYKIDVTNTGSDYYFENIPGCWGDAGQYCANPPKDPQAQSGANAFLDEAKRADVATLFTVSTLGWVAKAPPKYNHPFDCGCPASALAQQDSFDPYDKNCGNGQRNGAWLNCPAPATTSSAVDATWTRDWVAYLTNRLGPSQGRRIYALDNEPNLWSSTHHDVHPARLTYDELWQRMRDNAVAILDADPTATIAGPAEWGWPNYLCSDADDISKGCFPQSPDRAKHAGMELVPWLLEQARDYEKQSGRRILHYLDLHYYPQGGSSPDNTRSLWDPAYTDPSWINERIRLVPRMREWVEQHYPGTRLMVSEYDFYHHDEAIGAVTYAEVLGIFGREGLDGATAWSPPSEREAAFGAFALYRNYDGAGGAFESTSVRATVDRKGVAAFAAVSERRLTVALVNEGGAAVTVKIDVTGFTPAGSARLYAGSGARLVPQPEVTPAGSSYSVTLAPTSIAMLAAPGAGPATPDLGVPADLGPAAPLDGSSPPAIDLAAHGSDGATGEAAGGCGCRTGGRSASRGGTAWGCLGVVLMAAASLRRYRGTTGRRR